MRVDWKLENEYSDQQSQGTTHNKLVQRNAFQCLEVHAEKIGASTIVVGDLDERKTINI